MPLLPVRGIDALRMAEASIMPTLIGANTQAPTMMTAERAASIIRGDETIWKAAVV
jgi:choline dehydrogenase-like flavoprotein